MAPADAHSSNLRLTPAKSAMDCLSKEEVQRFFFKTAMKAQFTPPDWTPDAGCENFLDVHMIGRKDSKYMKYQNRTAPLCDRTLCEHTRAYIPHDLSDFSVTKEMATFVKSKQGVGRPNVTHPLDGNTRYTEEFKKFSKKQARSAIRETYVPVVSCTDDGRPSHPLRGTDRLEEKRSRGHLDYGPHPLELAKAEQAAAPKETLGPVGRLLPPSTAYREEFFHEKGVPRTVLRKPIRCKSAPTLRGPLEAYPRWMRSQVAEGTGWAESRVTPEPPQPMNGSAPSKPHRSRPVSAGAIGSNSRLLDKQESTGQARPPSAVARMETASASVQRPEKKPRESMSRPKRPSTAGGVRSRAS